MLSRRSSFRLFFGLIASPMAANRSELDKTFIYKITADPNVNWSEGQVPSSVNDSARAMMASAAKWRDKHPVCKREIAHE